MPSLMFGVLAPERLPIWKYPSVSYAEHGDYARGMAYTGTVHTVVDSAELFQGGLLGELLALFGSGQSALFVDVCTCHAFSSSFGKSDGCFFANAAGGLKERSQRGFVMGLMKTLAPVTSAMPSNETVPVMLSQDPRILGVDDFAVIDLMVNGF
ncbi:MAG: hypothetical protein Q9175_006938 [Cornicularia normoerica]